MYKPLVAIGVVLLVLNVSLLSYNMFFNYTVAGIVFGLIGVIFSEIVISQGANWND